MGLRLVPVPSSLSQEERSESCLNLSPSRRQRKFLRGPDGPSKSKGSGLPCLMSTDPSTPSTTPVRMREDRSEKGIWMATSSNVRGTDGDSTYKPANDRRIRPSPSTAVPSGSKEIKFRWRYRNTSPSPYYS